MILFSSSVTLFSARDTCSGTDSVLDAIRPISPSIFWHRSNVLSIEYAEQECAKMRQKSTCPDNRSCAFVSRMFQALPYASSAVHPLRSDQINVAKEASAACPVIDALVLKDDIGLVGFRDHGAYGVAGLGYIGYSVDDRLYDCNVRIS